MLDEIDRLTAELLAARLKIIGEWSGTILADAHAALHSINERRALYGLPPLALPDHYRDYDSD